MNQKAEKAGDLPGKVERAVSKDPDFSPSEIAVLHKVIKVWRSWEALGLGLRWFVTVVGLTAAGLTSWKVLAKAFKEWLTS